MRPGRSLESEHSITFTIGLEMLKLNLGCLCNTACAWDALELSASVEIENDLLHNRSRHCDVIVCTRW